MRVSVRVLASAMLSGPARRDRCIVAGPLLLLLFSRLGEHTLVEKGEGDEVGNGDNQREEDADGEDNLPGCAEQVIHVPSGGRGRQDLSAMLTDASTNGCTAKFASALTISTKTLHYYTPGPRIDTPDPCIVRLPPEAAPRMLLACAGGAHVTGNPGESFSGVARKNDLVADG